MARASDRPVATWIAVAAVGALAVCVVVLSLMALGRVSSPRASSTASPVPTFAYDRAPAQTQTPTPTSTPTAVAAPAEAERFFSAGASAWWRATAGACGQAAPLIERSTDGGGTWVDVTPRYLGLAQVASVDAISAADGEAVAAVGAGCAPQGLRTYTGGEFWEHYPAVLAASRFIAFGDPSTVVTPAGLVAAPCPQAWGFRASGDTLAVVCDGRAWTSTGGAWHDLGAAVAVAVAGADVVVAAPGDVASGPGASVDCDGVGVVRFTGGSAGAGIPLGCAQGADASSPAALAETPSGWMLWSGEQLLPVE